MRFDEIEKFMEKKAPVGTPPIKISFKTRSPVTGIFIKTADYHELSRKNLWRIVSESQLKSYNQSQDQNLARIFNGVDFTRLEVVDNK
jgi:hypothetical protein